MAAARMNPLTYLAMLVADSRKWSNFGTGDFDRTSPRFENIQAQIPASHGHFSFERETARVLFWRHPTGLHSDPMPVNKVLRKLRRL